MCTLFESCTSRKRFTVPIEMRKICAFADKVWPNFETGSTFKYDRLSGVRTELFILLTYSQKTPFRLFAHTSSSNIHQYWFRTFNIELKSITKSKKCRVWNMANFMAWFCIDSKIWSVSRHVHEKPCQNSERNSE